MAFNGGYWTVYNKEMGAFINFETESNTGILLSERGTVALPMVLNWGKDNEIFKVSQEDFQTNSLSIFGYDYTASELKNIREVFLNATEILFYKINGDGVKATGGIATAKYSGIRGNDLKYTISANIDDETKFDVKSYLGTFLIDEQLMLSTPADLVDNDFITFNKTGESFEETTQVLSGGTNGGEITGLNYQNCLEKFESKKFNVLICDATDDTIKALFSAYTKRVRDTQGIKFQTVIHKYEKADYEGVVSVDNDTVDGINKNELVYWLGGLLAGCEVNKSCTNQKYTGEYEINVDYKQTELNDGIKAGKFMFHQVDEDVKTYSDINTFVSYSEKKNKFFSKNQVIRVLDQIANDIAKTFYTKYLGQVATDKDGCSALWNDLDSYFTDLQKMRAIQNFSNKELSVVQVEGEKDSVKVDVIVQPTCAMEKLYMTVIVK